jgi:hypothetical protein
MKIGLIDSGLAPELIEAGARCLGDQADLHGHGVLVSRLIARKIAPRDILCAPIFDSRGVTTPLAVAAGLDDLMAQGARLLVLPLGLAGDRLVLRQAIARALDGGATIVASAPARGGPCFPAAYPGVISVCGDIRCAPDEVSWLGGEPALFGACPKAPGQKDRSHDGPSMAAGNFAAWLYPQLVLSAGDESLAKRLHARCAYFGRENKQA